MYKYKIIYNHEKTTITREFKTKKQAIKYYIELLETPMQTSINNLSIFRDNKDITIQVNKFLFN